jgi:CHAT domain-containing protein
MGLRRGFIEAGTENLLMTLWSVSDEATVQIMSDFYEAAHQSGDAPEALAVSAVESKPASGGRIKPSHLFPLNRSEML